MDGDWDPSRDRIRRSAFIRTDWRWRHVLLLEPREYGQPILVQAWSMSEGRVGTTRWELRRDQDPEAAFAAAIQASVAHEAPQVTLTDYHLDLERLPVPICGGGLGETAPRGVPPWFVNLERHRRGGSRLTGLWVPAVAGKPSLVTIVGLNPGGVEGWAEFPLARLQQPHRQGMEFVTPVPSSCCGSRSLVAYVDLPVARDGPDPFAVVFHRSWPQSITRFNRYGVWAGPTVPDVRAPAAPAPGRAAARPRWPIPTQPIDFRRGAET